MYSHDIDLSINHNRNYFTKNTKKRRRRFAPVLLTLALLGGGCFQESGDSGSDLFLLLFGFFNSGGAVTPPTQTQVALQVVDAGTGALLAPAGKTVTLTFTGANAGSVTDLSGNEITNITSNTGLFAFKSSATSLNTVVKVDGYIAGGRQFHFDNSGQATDTIPLVNIASPPTGVSVETKSIGTAAGDGSIAGTLNFNVAAEGVTGTKSGVSIPAGTVITDKDGVALSGALTATIAHFNDRSYQALLALPGGFAVSLTANENGIPEDTLFLTGGFLALEIKDASGRIAANFSNDMNFTTELKSGTTHPVTGAAVQVGDTIPTWSYNETTGAWAYETEGNVASESGGVFSINHTSNHLSYFNVDWTSTTCNASTVGISGNTIGAPITLIIRAANGFSSMVSTNSSSVSLQRPPQGLPVTLDAYFQGSLVGSVNSADLCSETPVVPVTLAVAGAATMTLQARAYCAAPALSDTAITGFAVYRPSSCGSIACPPTDAGNLTLGATTIPFVQPGVNYSLTVTTEHPTYGRKSATTTFTASAGGTLNLDVDYCSAVSGGPLPAGEEDLNWNTVDTGSVYSFRDARAYSAALDAAGNLYTAGSVSLVWWLKKFDSSAVEDTTNWNLNPVSGNGGEALATATDAAGNVYVAGWARLVISGKAYNSWRIRKYSPTGVEDTANWDKTFNTGVNNLTHKANAIAISGSAVYVVGFGEDLISGSSGADWWIKKFDLNGVEDTANWDKRISFSDSGLSEMANAVAVDASGNVYVTGEGVGVSGFPTLCVKKFTSAGVEITAGWDKNIEYTAGGNRGAYGRTIALDASGNVYVGGEANNYGAATGMDWYIKKFDSAGNEITVGWDKIITDNSSHDYLRKLLVDQATGDVFAVGYGHNLVSGISGFDWWIKKFDAGGNEDSVDWDKKIDGSFGEDKALDAVFGPGGSIFIVGYGTNLVDGSSGEDLWIKKFSR